MERAGLPDGGVLTLSFKLAAAAIGRRRIT